MDKRNKQFAVTVIRFDGRLRERVTDSLHPTFGAAINRVMQVVKEEVVAGRDVAVNVVHEGQMLFNGSARAVRE